MQARGRATHASDPQRAPTLPDRRKWRQQLPQRGFPARPSVWVIENSATSHYKIDKCIFKGACWRARAHLVGDRGRCAPPVSLYVRTQENRGRGVDVDASSRTGVGFRAARFTLFLSCFCPQRAVSGASGQPPLAVGACGAPQRRRTLPEGLQLCQAGKRNGEPCVGSCTHRLRALPRARPLHCRLATLALPPKVKGEKERRKTAERERMGAFPFCKASACGACSLKPPGVLRNAPRSGARPALPTRIREQHASGSLDG